MKKDMTKTKDKDFPFTSTNGSTATLALDDLVVNMTMNIAPEVRTFYVRNILSGFPAHAGRFVLKTFDGFELLVSPNCAVSSASLPAAMNPNLICSG